MVKSKSLKVSGSTGASDGSASCTGGIKNTGGTLGIWFCLDLWYLLWRQYQGRIDAIVVPGCQPSEFTHCLSQAVLPACRASTITAVTAGGETNHGNWCFFRARTPPQPQRSGGTCCTVILRSPTSVRLLAPVSQNTGRCIRGRTALALPPEREG